MHDIIPVVNFSLHISIYYTCMDEYIVQHLSWFELHLLQKLNIGCKSLLLPVCANGETLTIYIDVLLHKHTIG